MDYKDENDFDEPVEYEAYVITVLVGSLLGLEEADLGEVWEFAVEYLGTTGGLDGKDAEEFANQVKILTGKGSTTPGSDLTH